ncbi:hypothetical protein J1N35_025613 [Gossypium stocksii]|uniref:Uncharacterized protein n=1 Tax=Gossypium stocksii TaxID=47602 RepID=A0A9D3V6W5_9ROSI|nr:hypothetical protein J1N35_025613 [Gossypium stocksii]
MTSSLSTLAEDAPPVTTQYPDDFTPVIPVQFSTNFGVPMSPTNYTSYTDVDVEPYIGIDVDIYTATNDDIDSNDHATIDDDVDAWYLFNIPKIWGTLWLHAYSDPNITRITVLSG